MSTIVTKSHSQGTAFHHYIYIGINIQRRKNINVVREHLHFTLIRMSTALISTPHTVLSFAIGYERYDR
jgi:hypothetical protein